MIRVIIKTSETKSWASRKEPRRTRPRINFTLEWKLGGRRRKSMIDRGSSDICRDIRMPTIWNQNSLSLTWLVGTSTHWVNSTKPGTCEQSRRKRWKTAKTNNRTRWNTQMKNRKTLNFWECKWEKSKHKSPMKSCRTSILQVLSISRLVKAFRKIKLKPIKEKKNQINTLINWGARLLKDKRKRGMAD